MLYLGDNNEKKNNFFHILEIDPLLIETAIEIVNYKQFIKIYY